MLDGKNISLEIGDKSGAWVEVSVRVVELALLLMVCGDTCWVRGAFADLIDRIDG